MMRLCMYPIHVQIDVHSVMHHSGSYPMSNVLRTEYCRALHVTYMWYEYLNIMCSTCIYEQRQLLTAAVAAAVDLTSLLLEYASMSLGSA